MGPGSNPTWNPTLGSAGIIIITQMQKKQYPTDTKNEETKCILFCDIIKRALSVQTHTNVKTKNYKKILKFSPVHLSTHSPSLCFSHAFIPPTHSSYPHALHILPAPPHPFFIIIPSEKQFMRRRIGLLQINPGSDSTVA
jgi:hypothetical protein